MKQTPSSAWYALRRPLPDWRFDELLAEMVRLLPLYQVDEVIVMVDVEEFFHNHPTPETARRHALDLDRARQTLEQAGIAYSLNPWITRGHANRGRRASEVLPGIQTVVDADGVPADTIACPLCPVWLENLEQVWAIYARTAPRVLWIDDDIRDFGAHECFCPRHLAEFSRLAGRPVAREELRAALLQPGTPNPWREAWIRMRAGIMTGVLQRLSAAVRNACPTVRLGLMSSGPRNHCREGRDWGETARALGATPEHPVYSRPTLGNYWEWGPPRGLYFSQDSIKLTRHCLPAGTVDQTEVENVPFSRYSKSITFTFAQLAVSFAYGARGVTLDIFDFIGSPMEEEPHYGRMLAARKPFLDALARRAQRPGVFRGVGLLHRGSASWTRHLAAGAGLSHLAGEGYPALEAFEAAGIPTTYDPSPVNFLCGQQPRTLTDDELRTLLAGGLFLDATAAEILHQRGFGAEIGLLSIRAAAPLAELGAFSVEHLAHPGFGGSARAYMSAQLPMVDYSARFSILEPEPSAMVCGHLLDPDARPVHPAMTAFENARGGRVVVHAWDYASALAPPGVSFHNPTRVRQLQAAVRWLFRGHPPLMVSGDGAWPLAFRRDGVDGSLVGLFNLSLDAWPSAVFEWNDLPAGGPVEILEESGDWLPLDVLAAADGRRTVHRAIPLEHPLILWIPRLPG